MRTMRGSGTKQDMACRTVKRRCNIWLLLLASTIPAFCHPIPLTFFGPLASANGSPVFVAQGGSTTVLFRAGGIAFSRNGKTSRSDFLNAAGAAIPSGWNALRGHVNIVSQSPQTSHDNLSTFDSVEYRSLYKGIALRFTAEERHLKSEYLVEAHHDPGSILVGYPDARGIAVRADGSLVVNSELGEMMEAAPVLYQMVGGKRVHVDGAYELRSARTVGFRVGRYDGNLPLVIDPLLTFEVSIGGSGTDVANGVSKDAAGNIYMAGYTDSTDFATAPSPLPRGRGVDAWVMKLDGATKAFVYLTYLGGAGDDRAWGIAADADGAVYVCGSTTSSDFPAINAQQPRYSGARDGFVAKLDHAGKPVYSTYIGGSGDDSANAIAVDRSGNAYITGETDSSKLPVRTPFQAALAGLHDAFVAKFGPAGALVYATYLGGSGNDRGLGIALDNGGNAYITGSTESVNFPVFAPLQSGKGGGLQDAFVTKLNAQGTALVYSTYLGGSGGSQVNPEQGYAIAVDGAGSAYVVGATDSTDFPVVNAFQASYGGVGADSDAFVAKLDPAGSKLLYSTYLGGVGKDVAMAVRVDTAGEALVAGLTSSIDFPSVQAVSTAGGGYDAFLVKLGSGGNQLLFSTILGGQQTDWGSSLSGINETVVVGGTSSVDLFPGTRAINVLAFGVQIAPVAPFGNVDTPKNGDTGLNGAIAMTGWAFCEDQVPAIQVWRNTVPGESAYPAGMVYLANAVFLPGARPDVQAAFPAYPYNERAGWGVQILTNMLPNASGAGGLGNGTYTFHALALNQQKQTTDIGQKTVTVDNAHALPPFGTIDTPGNGETISGIGYVNFGWALTPQPNIIPTDGSTMLVYIDNVAVGHPVYNNLRSDIAGLFPGLKNSNGAVGYYIIDTTKLANGMHSIQWGVSDSAAHGTGLGSRLFFVQN